MRKFFRLILPDLFKHVLRNARWVIRSDFSQNGEQNLLLDHLPPSGTYLEIGAGQPLVYNNTFALARRFGWRGLSIDAQKSLWLSWRVFRPGDCLIRMLVMPHAGEAEEAILFRFPESSWGMSTSDGERARLVAKSHNLRAIQESCPTMPVADVYRQHINTFGSPPTLLHLDVEGLDVPLLGALLSSVDSALWPEWILIELLSETALPKIATDSYAEVGRVGPSFLLRRCSPEGPTSR